uniref:Jacalin-like lectin domain-containing protein n=1 Tax=Lactuca sativa TaxID=4236 RepID=A0A9R1UN20_LACSA|nr:hypothetical protein LSAT_V11C800429620 [Lactuca sativa]
MEGVQHLKIPLDEIKFATNNFSDENSIGKGAYGKVYAAKLSLSGQQRIVAIKRLNKTSNQGEPQFLMEIQLLSCYKHKNLISLVGFCDENREKILVYEYAKHGSLDKYLSTPELSWTQRLQISIGAARGFNYLHNDVGPQHRVLHRDIKSSNILLHENWEAKISDFGLSKIGPSNVECTFLLTSPCGTIGYVDPEYARTGILTKESDVYPFGVVLFEILCGRLARTKNQDKNLLLPILARKCYEQNRLIDIIHPNLTTQVKVDSLEMFSMVAYQCLKENRSERPTMGWIVEKLEKALELQADIKAARLIRIGTWGRHNGDSQHYWSFTLEQDDHLSKITIDHGDGIHSLMFTSESRGVLHTSNKVGGWASGDKLSELYRHAQVTFDGDEEIIGIDGTIGTRGSDQIISSLSFKTNKKIHGPFGQAGDHHFSVPWEEGRFVGFHGVAGPYIDSIGVYVKAYEEIVKVGTWGKSKADTLQSGWSFQLERNHHLKKITIDHGDHIYSLMFTSEHRGLLHTSRLAGGWNGGEGGETLTEVTFDWNEDIHAINGTIGLSMGQHYAGQTVISSISFVTNKKVHGPFGHPRGTPFTVPWEDCSFVGFYGLAGWYINSIGVYLKATT